MMAITPTQAKSIIADFRRERNKRTGTRDQVKKKLMSLTERHEGWLSAPMVFHSYRFLKKEEKKMLRNSIYEFFFETHYYGHIWKDIDVGDKAYIIKVLYALCSKEEMKIVLKELKKEIDIPLSKKMVSAKRKRDGIEKKIVEYLCGIFDEQYVEKLFTKTNVVFLLRQKIEKEYAGKSTRKNIEKVFLEFKKKKKSILNV